MPRTYNPATVKMVLWDGTEEAFLEVRQLLPDNKTVCRGEDLLAIVTPVPNAQIDPDGNDLGREQVVRARVGQWVVFDPSTPLLADIMNQEQVDRRYPEVVAPTRV